MFSGHCLLDGVASRLSHIIVKFDDKHFHEYKINYEKCKSTAFCKWNHHLVVSPMYFQIGTWIVSLLQDVLCESSVEGCL